MKAALFLYLSLLVIEGTLAWITGGDAFLAVALVCSLAVYYSVSRSRRQLAEATRLVAAGILVLAAPFHYQVKLVPLLISFAALPHFLATTQALWERQWGNLSSSPANLKMRAMVFTIGFYAAMGLVLLLLRGMEPEIPRLVTTILAVIVLLLALPAWELSRVTRLKPGQAGPAPWQGRNALITGGLLALVAVLFAGPLPMAADFLGRISPHWRMDPIEFKNKPPKPPANLDKKTTNEEAIAPAPQESAQTGRAQLPKRSNLQGTNDIEGFVRLNDPAQAQTLLEHGPLYIRSHTLNRFDGEKWEADVTGGVWVKDSDDGKEDGLVIFRTTDQSVAYEMFLLHADGYSMPAIQNLTAVALPRVYAIPGDVLQTTAAGDFKFRAVSSPLVFENLPNSIVLRPGQPSSPIHSVPAKGELGVRLHQLAESIFGLKKELPERIALLRQFLHERYQYDGRMTNPHGIDPLQNFLFDERKGYCDFFATAAALILRDAGIPTRMAYGFATDEVQADSGTFTFRNRNAHSWTEIYIDQIGWTICDFTPPANIGKVPGSPPEPPKPPEFDPNKFTDAAKQEPPPPPPNAPKTEVASDTLAGLMDKVMGEPWFQFLKTWGAGIAVVIAALLLAWRWFRKTPEEAAAAARAKELAAREKQPAYFVEYLRVTTAAGHPKPDGDTPLEHYWALNQAGLPMPTLRPLINYHYAQRYQDVPPDDEREKAFFDDLKTFAEAAPPPPEPES